MVLLSKAELSVIWKIHVYIHTIMPIILCIKHMCTFLCDYTYKDPAADNAATGEADRAVHHGLYRVLACHHNIVPVLRAVGKQIYKT